MRKIFVFIPLFCLLIIAGCANSKTKETPVGGSYDENAMKSLVNPPKKIPPFLRSMIKIADKKAEKEMIMGRVLAWSPKIAISSGILELYIEEGAAACLEERMIKILRIIISYTVPSQFALDINSWNFQDFGITEEEIKGLRGVKEIDSIASFTDKEKTALKYAYQLSKTPIVLSQKLLDDLRSLFSAREIVAIAALTAKVNYWARLMEAMRIKPAGYTDDPVLHLEEYKTFVK
ncbi:carboxymuconolactone decarboxylase family protein [bacterium]|nr:carboxymuconolactone decarboxylase family protein [bacterium]